MSFLSAEWRKLVLANYNVNADLLLPYLPAHTELDIWQNRCYLSLVGFMFLNTKLLGIPIPFHRNFEEVNLRFYVKHFDGDSWKRGVVFIKEIVPKPALSLVANSMYKEHYVTCKMSHKWEFEETHQKIAYAWKNLGSWQNIEVVAALQKQEIVTGTEAEFITEHYWGYTKVNPRKTFEYQVTHPVWHQYEVQNFHLEVEYGAVYGKQFSFLNDLIPTSVLLAEGSKITVENKRRL